MKTLFHTDPEESGEGINSARSSLRDPKDLDQLMEMIGESKYVLLGEASHGTHEYYTWRTEISKRLIAEKGFSFIAVEGDWPDCYEINRAVKSYPDAPSHISDVLKSFRRWPTWMWSNWETAGLGEWLKRHNMHLKADEKVGFYGLDVYSLWESLETLEKYLESEDPKAATLVKEALNCFAPFEKQGKDYGLSSYRLPGICEDKIVQMLKEIRSKAYAYNHDHEAPLNTEQNAFVALNAEKYYRAMFSFGPKSWNIRDLHMADTLDRLMKFHGPEAKAIIWEHNTHIGDARATNMMDEGMLNIGQVVRERHSKEGVVLVGFGSYKGTVVAASEWGAPMKVMKVPEARTDSIEALLHEEFKGNSLLILKDKKDKYAKRLGHRAIGVVYSPDKEKYGNYVPTVLNKRYDAFIYIDETRALHPLQLYPDLSKIADTFPFGT